MRRKPLRRGCGRFAPTVRARRRRPASWTPALGVLFAALGALIFTLNGLARVIALAMVIAAFAIVCALKTEGGWKWRGPPT